jgi:rhodanese-related sulfurtransferase
MYIFKNLMILGLIFAGGLFAKESVVVKITEDIPYLYVTHMGQKIKVARIQDTNNVLTDDYTKTSRECPPFCIHPTKINDDVKTIAEVEIVNFLKDKVPSQKGVVIDARLKSWYELETIPSAINIPYTIIQSADKKMAQKMFSLLGMKVEKNGTWNFDDAKELAVFCNGIWCEQSHHFIEGMLKFGYPAEKMFYYRSGFQGWKLLGLTTVVQKENKN